MIGYADTYSLWEILVKTDTESSPRPGRPRRAYNSPLREEQARQTRARIVLAAAGLFAERGYGATTLQAIAAAAGVSVVSVQLNGPKSALLLAALEQISTGSEGFDSAAEVPEFAERAAQITSAADIIRLTAEFAAASNQRVSKLWLAMDRAADDDADVGHTFRDLIHRMRGDALTAITAMTALGHVRDDRTPEELADIYWALPLPDLYHRLVEQGGWTIDRYTNWLEQTMTELLLPQPENSTATHTVMSAVERDIHPEHADPLHAERDRPTVTNPEPSALVQGCAVATGARRDG